MTTKTEELKFTLAKLNDKEPRKELYTVRDTETKGLQCRIYPSGKKTLEIPKGTQPGDIFRFKGEGIPSLRYKSRGDQIIQVLIKTPTGLTRKQESLLKEFAKLESKKISNKLKNILKGGSETAAG